MKTFYLSMLTVLWLTGCASHVHQLVKKDGVPFTAGELVHASGENNRLVLEMSNRRYEAHGFAVMRHIPYAELRKRYYSSYPKHWDQISSGLNTDHVFNHVKTIAKSAEGQEISCNLTWESGTKAEPAGICTDQAGTAFPVRFEQH